MAATLLAEGVGVAVPLGLGVAVVLGLGVAVVLADGVAAEPVDGAPLAVGAGPDGKAGVVVPPPLHALRKSDASATSARSGKRFNVGGSARRVGSVLKYRPAVGNTLRDANRAPLATL